MKINRVHAILGFLLVVTPLLGLPLWFKRWSPFFIGIAILYFALKSIHVEFQKKNKRTRHDTFVESKPKHFTPITPKPEESSQVSPEIVPEPEIKPETQTLGHIASEPTKTE